MAIESLQKVINKNSWFYFTIRRDNLQKIKYLRYSILNYEKTNKQKKIIIITLPIQGIQIERS